MDANWIKYGLSGGPLRNKRMLQLQGLLSDDSGQSPLVVAFPGDKGTGNMIEVAKAHNVLVLRYPELPSWHPEAA
jgi:hypothetical protein